MTTSGSATYFDGVTSARQEVSVALGPDGVQIRAADGTSLAQWPYGKIAAFAAPQGRLRLGLADSPLLARLDIREAALAAALEQRCGSGLRRIEATDRRTRIRVVGWSLAAVISIALVAVFGVPALSDRLAPLVPVKIETRFGNTVDKQIRAILDHDRRGAAFECGLTDRTKAGRRAFDKLVGQLAAAAALPVPVTAAIIRRSEANAVALPGGHVYVFEGLIGEAESPDELAGVIAHEMGHVAHRDGVRAVMQTAGLSFLFGMLLGDFSGGGAAVMAVRTVLQSSYSRETEGAADLYGAALVSKIGGDPRALGAILMRIADPSLPPAGKILLDHPESKGRAAAIEALGLPAAKAALLAPGEWIALKKICAGK
jgi:Zn-dependent protease with chaperone function